MNTEDFSLQTFYEKDGIAHNEFNFSSHLLTADSFLYLGGVNGITEIDLRYTKENSPFGKSDLPLVMNACTIYDNKNESRTITNLEEGIPLQYDDTYFDLDFSIVDFSGKPTFDFAYKIEEIQQDWIHKNDRKLQLSKPSFGQYTLRIKARGEDGRWSANELVIPLISSKPLFLSTWFFILVSIGILGIIFLLFKFRLRYLERKNLKLEEEVIHRTTTIQKQLVELQSMKAHKEKIFSIIGHDLRSPILGMRNFSKKINFLLQEKRLEQLNILAGEFDHKLESIHHLLNNLLDWSRLEQKKQRIKFTTVELNNVVKENLALYESQILEKQLQLSLIQPTSILVHTDKKAVTTIIRNLLDNAVKFTPINGDVLVEIVEYEQGARLTIQNSGEEVPEHIRLFLKEGTKDTPWLIGGFGLQICKELVSLCDLKWEIYSSKETGTVFQLYFNR